MRQTVIIIIIIFLVIPDFADASESSNGCGIVSGKIHVWRTRVRTEGSRNDKDVIVYLRDISGNSYSASAQTVHMDQKNLIFIPHVLPVRENTSVRFLNSDSVDHNVYLLFETNGESLDLGTWGQGKTTEYLFNEKGVVIVLCKLHLEMAAYVIVLDNPFFFKATIDKETQSGAYSIKDIPPGKYTLHSWHKKLKMKGSPAQITVEENQTTHFNITITKSKYAK